MESQWQVRAVRSRVLHAWLLGLATLLLASACADSSTTTLAPEPAATTPTETISTAAPTTGPAATTSLAPAPTTTRPPTTTTLAPTAADGLAEFFAAVEELDAEIAAAADAFNAGFDPDAGTVAPAAAKAIAALSSDPVAELIPAGMNIDLETAVLAVFADLDSRVAALQGAADRVFVLPDGTVNVEDALFCLGLGSESKERFASDLAASRALADRLPAQPAVALDSPEAGILAVRLSAIVSMNIGCDSCGGVAYEEPIEVDWEGRTVFGSVGFEAEFDGTQWQIIIFAC